MSFAWVFNLDAEDELSHPGAHTPTAAMVARIESLLPRLTALLEPGDQLLWPGNGEPLRPGLVGRAWCPTRWAREQFVRVNVAQPPLPSLEVLCTVNHRRFNHRLGQTMPGAGYAENEPELRALLSTGSGPWLLKRAFGYAGRGRRLLRGSQKTDADQAWVDASLRTGEGLQVEPLQERELDCALHGGLDQEGNLTLGRPTIQDVDEHGAWQATRLARDGELTRLELDRLINETKHVALALHAAGYFGPFGVDGFRYRGGFQPRSEVNARYSMGWATGMRG